MHPIDHTSTASKKICIVLFFKFLPILNRYGCIFTLISIDFEKNLTYPSLCTVGSIPLQEPGSAVSPRIRSFCHRPIKFVIIRITMAFSHILASDFGDDFNATTIKWMCVFMIKRSTYRRADQPGKSEIKHFHNATVIHDNVGRLEVLEIPVMCSRNLHTSNVMLIFKLKLDHHEIKKSIYPLTTFFHAIIGR